MDGASVWRQKRMMYRRSIMGGCGGWTGQVSGDKQRMMYRRSIMGGCGGWTGQVSGDKQRMMYRRSIMGGWTGASVWRQTADDV